MENYRKNLEKEALNHVSEETIAKLNVNEYFLLEDLWKRNEEEYKKYYGYLLTYFNHLPFFRNNANKDNFKRILYKHKGVDLKFIVLSKRRTFYNEKDLKAIFSKFFTKKQVVVIPSDDKSDYPSSSSESSQVESSEEEVQESQENENKLEKEESSDSEDSEDVDKEEEEEDRELEQTQLYCESQWKRVNFISSYKLLNIFCRNLKEAWNLLLIRKKRL